MQKCRIIISTNGRSILEQELSSGVYILGRSQDSDLKIDVPDVSRTHLEIHVDENGVTLTDRSSSGTYFDNRRIPVGFLLQNEMEVHLGKTTVLTCSIEAEDPNETIIAPTNPEAAKILSPQNATQPRNINLENKEKVFFEGTNPIDSTFATEMEGTRSVPAGELESLRKQDARKRQLKLFAFAIGGILVIATLIVLYSINFSSVEESLTWPCDKKGQVQGRFIDSQIGSFSTGQFSLSVPFISGVSSVKKQDNTISVLTRFGKDSSVPLRITVIKLYDHSYIRKNLRVLFVDVLNDLQKSKKQMSYSALSEIFYMGNDNGIPCYGADYTIKDEQGNAWFGYVIAFKNGSDLFLRFAEVPLHERARALDSISTIPFLKFSPAFVEIIWDGADSHIPGDIDDILAEINKHLSKQAPFEWQRTYLLITTILAKAQESKNAGLENQALELLRILRKQQKKWYNAQKKNFFQAELERKDTRSIIELCKTVFSSPNDLRYQMLRRNRWE